ncbi:MAG: hypothetical protein WCL71_13200 [Deltaproteobacteria bacterium]
MHISFRHLQFLAVYAASVGSTLLTAQESERKVGEPVGGVQQGYFPTYQESRYLGSKEWDTSRLSGNADFGGGPDLKRMTSTGGFWRYEPGMETSNGLQRALSPLDYVFRPFTPGVTMVTQGPTSNSWLQMGAAFPFLTRTLHPDETTTSDLLGVEGSRKWGKYMPLYLDVLSVSVIGLYDTISGPGAVGVDDGWLSALELDLRAGVVITDKTSLLVHGKVYLIASESRSGVGAYLDSGGLNPFISLNIREELGRWDIRIFDDATPFSTRSLLKAETETEYVGSVGHYSTGVTRTRLQGGSFWDSQNTYLNNTAGITAGTFLGSDFRFLAGFARSDTWMWDDFNNHTPSEYLSAGLFYDSYNWWIAPSLTYTLSTHDFKDAEHTISLNGTAPLSHRATLNAGIGYSFGEVADTLDWHIGAGWDQTERLRHNILYSSGYQDLSFGDSFYGQNLTYVANYRLAARTTIGWTNHWFHEFDIDNSSFLSGLNIDFLLGNYTQLRLMGAYNEYDRNTSPASYSGSSWIYEATLSHRLASRLTAELSYFYNRNRDTINTGYDEQAVMLKLTRSF